MTTSKISRKRCDSTGRAFAGSQRQIQYYVNEQPAILQQAISDALEVLLSIRWVSPLRSERYREYRDLDFLTAVGLVKSRNELSQFWPRGGPCWDALGIDELRGGIVLIEAKSHVPEISGNGCGAIADSSVGKIDASLAATKAWLGVTGAADWKGDFYQTANRLAHLYFLREILHIEAWLVNVYFSDDPHSPTSRTAWAPAIAEVKKCLGIDNVPFYADVFLQAWAPML